MDDTTRIVAALGWPQDISQERLVASVFDRAIRGDMPIAAEMILHRRGPKDRTGAKLSEE